MKNDLIKALKSMGYREASKDIWAKPVGYSFLTFDISKNTIASWFVGVNQKHYCWSSEIFDPMNAEILSFIKEFESGSKFAVGETSTSFEFLTTEQQIEEFL